MPAQYLVSWRAGTTGTTARSWLTAAHRAMAPHASGAAYQNYADPTPPTWKKAYYGPALPHLTQVKRQYDPTGFFTYAQSL